MMIIHKLFVVCVQKHFSRTEREKEAFENFSPEFHSYVD